MLAFGARPEGAHDLRGAFSRPVAGSWAGQVAAFFTALSNVIGVNGLPGSGSCVGCNAFFINPHSDGTATLDIRGNITQQMRGGGVIVRTAANGRAHATVTGNLIRVPESTSVAIEVRSGNSSGPPADAGCVVAEIGGPNTPGTWPSTDAGMRNRIEGNWNGGSADIFVWGRFSTTVNIPNWTGAPGTYVHGRNSFSDVASGTTVLSDSGVPIGTASSCP